MNFVTNGVDIEICLGKNQGNFPLYKFTRKENTAKSFRGATFLTYTVYHHVDDDEYRIVYAIGLTVASKMKLSLLTLLITVC